MTAANAKQRGARRTRGGGGVRGAREGKFMEEKSKKKKKKQKRSALVVCRDRKEFWTTQAQFWQWVRDGVVTKTGDAPLAGEFRRDHEELLAVISNTVLDLGHPNHTREALLARRLGHGKK